MKWLYENDEPYSLKAFKLVLFIISLLSLNMMVYQHQEWLCFQLKILRLNSSCPGGCPYVNHCKLDCEAPKNYNHSLYGNGYRTLIHTQACVFENNSRFYIQFSNATKWIGVNFADQDIFQEKYNYADIFIFPNNLAYYMKFRRIVDKKIIRNCKVYLGFASEYEENSSYITTLLGIDNGYSSLDLMSESLFTEVHTELFGLFGTLGGALSLMSTIYTVLFGMDKIKPWGVLHKYGCFAKQTKKIVEKKVIDNNKLDLKKFLEYVVDTKLLDNILEK
ncbi:32631_t:CDS:2 [Gigaspora margarita]|uniref:32631_t:CDS:1 n=1 Tax=Gigaspora margarita TaxID=4874 RepID=A0ABN7VEL1_GIGMA|nr:32631_t:CDS:2 [Gigaspora margarita]